MGQAATIAEFGTALVAMTLGLSAQAAAYVIPVATLAATFASIRQGDDELIMKRAMADATNALKDCPDFTTADLDAAAAWIKSSQTKLRFDPLAVAQARGDLPDYLSNLLCDPSLPADGATTRILRMALTSAFEVCRHHPAYDRIFSQEMLITLGRDHSLMTEKLNDIAQGITRGDAAISAQLSEIMSKLDTVMPSTLPQGDAALAGKIINLANNYSSQDINDPDVALSEIENMLKSIKQNSV